MATTRLAPLHKGTGRSLSGALSDIINYVKNPDKTDSGEYVSSYECDVRTVESEFFLSKRQYTSQTGRSRGKDDVIAYHLRQSFRPGEITPEDANQIGRELAIKLTKGEYAFIVCTHVDKEHIHNHIIFNSTSLDCSKKFRNFWGSTWAVRRINDRLCVEHGLSIVEDPKPRKRHYGEWLGDSKPVTYTDQLKQAIDSVLEKSPKDFEEFVRGLEELNITVNREQKYLRLKMPGQERFRRCDTLKGDYTEEAIRERISGTRVAQSDKILKSNERSQVGLLIDIEAAIKSGKGPGYERWAKVFNLKQLSQAVIYLKEHGDMKYDELLEKCKSATAGFNDLSTEIKTLEDKMNANAELQKQIANYAKTRAVYVDYRKSGYSKKYRAEHEGDILIHQAAKKYFDGIGITKLPSVRELRAEYEDLLTQKRKAYASYKQARDDLKELYNVKANVDYLLDDTDRKDRKKNKIR